MRLRTKMLKISVHYWYILQIKEKALVVKFTNFKNSYTFWWNQLKMLVELLGSSQPSAKIKKGYETTGKTFQDCENSTKGTKRILASFPSIVSWWGRRFPNISMWAIECGVWEPFAPSLLVEIFEESFFDQSQSSCNISVATWEVPIQKIIK